MEVCYFSPNLIDVKEWVAVFILDQSHGVVGIIPCRAASKVILLYLSKFQKKFNPKTHMAPTDLCETVTYVR